MFLVTYVNTASLHLKVCWLVTCHTKFGIIVIVMSLTARIGKVPCCEYMTAAPLAIAHWTSQHFHIPPSSLLLRMIILKQFPTKCFIDRPQHNGNRSSNQSLSTPHHIHQSPLRAVNSMIAPWCSLHFIRISKLHGKFNSLVLIQDFSVIELLFVYLFGIDSNKIMGHSHNFAILLKDIPRASMRIT